MTPTALVWFKRDLRLHDHAPLAAAQAFERSQALYVIEPEGCTARNATRATWPLRWRAWPSCAPAWQPSACP